MIIKQDETRNQSITNANINGFYLTVMLTALTNNTLIKKTQYGTGLDFDASKVMINATLKRDGKTFPLFNTNLGLLGWFNSHLSGGKNWLLGTDFIRPTANTKHKNIRTLFIDLGTVMNLKGTDEVFIECYVGRETFQSTTIDDSNSYIDIKSANAIGKEVGIYQLVAETIQAGTTTDSWNLGDNVTKIGICNFEDSDETQQIIQNVRISSDRYDESLTLADLVTRNMRIFGKQPYNKGYDRTTGTVTDSYTPALPQSFIVLNDEEIDGARMDISFDGSKVNSSKNFVLWQKFDTSLEIIQRGQAMEAKHTAENLNKLPVTL